MIVKGVGELDSKLWLIGEAPGVHEVQTGLPFTGGAGTILDGLLKGAGIKREECYIDNVIQVRPPGNNFDMYYSDKSRHIPTSALLQAHKRLTDLVRTYRPNLVVALGNEALYALTGEKLITKRRGSILGCSGVKVMGTIHPAMVMRQWGYYPLVQMDLKKAQSESATPDFSHRYKDELITNPTFSRSMDYLEKLMHHPYLSFDIETEQDQITCVGFAWEIDKAICIPIFYGGTSWWTREEEFSIVKGILRVLLNPHTRFIAQNAQFDLTVMHRKWGLGVDNVNLWLDTMLAFHTLYPELRKGLDLITSIYTDRPYYKDTSSGGPSQLWHYNTLDCVSTWESAMKIVEELKEFGMEDYYYKHVHSITKPLMNMGIKGVRIDLRKRAGIDHNLDRDIESMLRKCELVVGHPLNPNSPKDMKQFLYHELGLPPQRNRITKVITANEEALEYLSKKFPNPVFSLVLDIRKARKILSTYIRAQLGEDGRMRCSYNIAGTTTGRLSSSAFLSGEGTNLQNIPRGELVRSLFIPDEGKMMVNADQSQAEARVVAYISGEERLQAIFEHSDEDVHKRNAAFIFHKRMEDITPSERYLGKVLVHAANYGIGALGFARITGQSTVKSQALLNQYYAIYPCIKLWHREVAEQLRNSRILTTPFGRKRMFFGRWSNTLVREALSFVPQSTVCDLINLGIANAWTNMPDGWNILLQVHDSILMQVPIDTPPIHIRKFIDHYFEIPLKIKNKIMRVPLTIKTGPNWGELTPLEV